MSIKIAKMALKFLLKYIIGLVFSVICFTAAIVVSGILTMVIGMSSWESFRIVFGTALLIGIPIGSVLGIFLVDKYILEIAVLKQQIIAGFIAGAAASVSMVTLHFCGVKILPYGHDGTSGLIGGFGIVYIVCVLIALLGYTIAGLTKRKTTNETVPQKEQEGS